MQIKKMISSLKGLFFLGALLLLSTFSASNTSADFYVIAGSKGVGTKINALPYTISSSGFYFIAKDLSCAGGSPGITITADNVTLDLMGFSLIGPGGTSGYHGIWMDARTNVEIRNGTVRNFPVYGIYDSNVNGADHRIINIRVKDNYLSGIHLYGKSHLVEKCTAVNNGSSGIWVNDGCTVTGNTCRNNLYGITTNYGCTVTGNTCYNNTDDGIYADRGCTVTGNTCHNNTDDGIYAGWGCTVIGNTCYDNTDHGIRLGRYCLVDQNTAYNNTITNIENEVNCIYGTNNPMVP